MLRRLTISPRRLPPLSPAAISSGEIPHFGPPLRELARQGMRVTIAFTDATRRTPDDLLIAAMLRELEDAGVRRADVTLLCAVGLHRPMTPDERTRKLGPDIAGTMRVVDHDPRDVISLGAIGDLPASVNRLCATDLLMATGVVEPHQYAGYSGGAKTVAIGCAGEETITATHGAAMIDRDGVRLGVVEGNPFQEFVRRAGELAGLRYVANVVLDADGVPLAAACGAPGAVHDHLVSVARSAYEVEVNEPVHMAIAGVPAAKAANLYQASRAATYLALSSRTPLLHGAPIILPAAIPEGAGEGLGEARFLEMLSSAESPAALVESVRMGGFRGGAQRAYVLAKVLARHSVIVAGAQDPSVVRACHMHAAPDLQAAIGLATEMARARFGAGDLVLLEVPNALVTLVRRSRAAES
jgi:nickel-dependent lactate racemase